MERKRCTKSFNLELALHGGGIRHRVVPRAAEGCGRQLRERWECPEKGEKMSDSESPPLGEMRRV